jgi:hypothetical protein
MQGLRKALASGIRGLGQALDSAGTAFEANPYIEKCKFAMTMALSIV